MAPKAKSTDKKSKPKTIAERVLNRKRAPKEILRYNDKDFKHAGIATVGDGKRLADIEMIRKSITHLRKNGDTLALIHRAIYQTRGSNETRKEDILNYLLFVVCYSNIFLIPHLSDIYQCFHFAFHYKYLRMFLSL